MSYARSAVTRMTLDMSRLDLQRSETVTQGDTNRRWEVTLINGGAPFRLPPNWTAALTGIKPDGNGLQNGCSVVDGKIIYDFAAGKEIATCVGSYPVQFDVWDEVGELVASPKVYVNVLADVRPHAELDSEGQYTLIGDLIGRVNQTDADVDLLGETALAQGDAIAALKEKITTAGTIPIPASEWTDTLPKLASPEQPVLVKGTVALLMPSNTASQIAARKAKITVQAEPYKSGNIIVQREDGEAPTENITLDYIIIKVDNPEAPPKAALIGVDAYGEGGGGTGGVSQAELEAAIKAVVPEWALADEPPEDAVTSVNGQTGEVKLTIPSEAADVGADPVGTAESMTAALRDEVNGKLADYDKSTAVNKKIGDHNVSTTSHEDLRLELQRLADRLNAALNSDDTSLDDLKEIVAYIKANKTLLDGFTSSKVNVTDIVDNLVTNKSNFPLSAAQGVVLKLLIDSLEDVVEGKVTADQAAAQIKAALADYLTKEKIAELYQPKGNYLTSSDIPTIPDKLPNPQPLTINGKTYDGSQAVSVNVDGSGEETPSIVLPSKLYAVAGHEFVLYYKNILRAMRPDDFAVTTAFASGSTLPNLKPLYDGYLRFTPAEAHVGSHTLTIMVFSRRTWEVVATKGVTLVISSDKAIAGKKVMYIGDSLTYASVYPAEIQNMSSDGIMSVGIVSHSISFNGGTAAIKSEGRNSAASYDYVNKQTFAGYDNPFYNPNTEYKLTLDGKYTTGLLNLDNTGSVSVLKHHFDFAYYMANNGDTVGEPDAVFINLGTNGGNKSAYQAVFIAFDAMIERIKAYNADLPVFLHLFPPKSEAGSTDRTAGGTVSGWLNARTWYYDIILTFIDRYDSDPRVTLVPTYTMLHPVYDYKRETVAVSARNTEQITIGQTDGTHPANAGYLHMADSYYNILQAHWSGEESGETETTYTITNNLTNVTNSNTATTVKEGNAYTATLTAASGYTLDSVTVTMGGEPVSVSGGKISISAVTGDIFITATAIKDEEPEEPTVVNLVDPSTANDASPNTALDADEWVNGYTITGSNTTLAITQADGRFVSDKFPISDNAKVRIKGMDMSSSKRASNKLLIIMSDGRIFRSMAMPIGEPGTASVDQSLVDSEGIMLVTISAFGQAASWPGKAYARICGYPKDGDNYNVVVTVE